MTQLFERAWPVDAAKAAVVIVHGLAEHSGRYDYVARKLNAAGYAVYAQDLRGHGQSVGFPGDMGGDVHQIVSDIVVECERVRTEHPKTFLLGHSMGTLYSLPAVVQAPAGTLAGLILSGIAVVPGPAVLASLASGEGIPPETVSRDPEIVKAYIDDPLVFNDSVPPEIMTMAVEATTQALQAIPLVPIPTLLVHGSADVLCDMSGAQQAHTELVITDKTLKIYEGLYHEVLNEPERDGVIADVVTWLDAH
jgi:alpha-beta hydrolase superfamily lysophospholipase